MNGIIGCSSRSAASSTKTRLRCTASARRVAAGEASLGELDVPVAELAPEEVVERAGDVAELEGAASASSTAPRQVRKAREDPAVGDGLRPRAGPGT